MNIDTGRVSVPFSPDIRLQLSNPDTDNNLFNISSKNNTSSSLNFFDTMPQQPSSSLSTSTATTPDLSLYNNSKTYSNENNDFNFKQSISNLKNIENFDDEADQTDNTVIHHTKEDLESDAYSGNFKSSISFSQLQLQSQSQVTLNDSIIDDNYKNFEPSLNTNDITNIIDGDTKTCFTLDESLDFYVNSIKQSKTNLNNELYSLFEEFKFDLITDHLSIPIESIHSHHNDRYKNILKFDSNNNGNQNKIQTIDLSTTIYSLLLHSIKPELYSFAILCFVKRKFHKLNKKTILSLLILSVYNINMVNNASIGIKLYANTIITRTNKFISLLTLLEKYFFDFNIMKNNKKWNNTNINNVHSNVNNNSKLITKLNLISSSIHLLISILVKKIGKMITFVLDIGCLWKYIVVYGLNNDLEEIKIIRNIIENPTTCSCIWFNEINRLIKTLQYIKKLFLCIIMSCIEIKNNENKAEDENKAKIFMKNFWSKFGYKEIKWNINNLTFPSRLLGLSIILDDSVKFLQIIKFEIIDDNNFQLDKNEEKFSKDIEKNSRLEIVNERNEDERIREVSKIVDKIGYKLDLIELGIKNKDNNDNKENNNSELFEIRNDINLLVNKYNEITSGKLVNSLNKDITISPIRVTRCNDNNLKKLRMSEILFDDNETNSSNNEFEKLNRRSSGNGGLNIKLISIIKDTEIDENVYSEDILRRNVSDKEFKDQLDSKLSDKYKKSTRKKLGESVRLTSHHDTETETERDTDTDTLRTNEAGFEEFKKELKLRLMKENADI